MRCARGGRRAGRPTPAECRTIASTLVPPPRPLLTERRSVRSSCADTQILVSLFAVTALSHVSSYDTLEFGSTGAQSSLACCWFGAANPNARASHTVLAAAGHRAAGAESHRAYSEKQASRSRQQAKKDSRAHRNLKLDCLPSSRIHNHRRRRRRQ